MAGFVGRGDAYGALNVNRLIRVKVNGVEPVHGVCAVVAGRLGRMVALVWLRRLLRRRMDACGGRSRSCGVRGKRSCGMGLPAYWV